MNKNQKILTIIALVAFCIDGYMYATDPRPDQTYAVGLVCIVVAWAAIFFIIKK
jgi:hypothetical protein